MIIFLYLLIQVLFAVFIFFLCISFITGAPFVPSTTPTTKRMVEMANITPQTVIADLGSGEGRILFEAVRKGAKQSIGYEINILLVIFTIIRIWLSPYRSRIQCSWKNYWNTTLNHVDVVFIYLLPWKMEHLGEKLKKELKPGSLVISNSFIFPNLQLIEKDEQLHVYAFRI